MSVVVHDNPGEIDPASFTTFGLNAKPNSASPIGYFGTGLKMAIAVLVRLGADVTIWVGERPYVFFTERKEFRGKTYDAIRMRRKRGVTARWFSEDLPFTTELAKNWEIWQALRELHSNALDEGGDTTAEEWTSVAQVRAGVAGRTRVVVNLPAYSEAFSRLSDVFLPEADRSRRGGVQHLDRPSRSLYYRGLRVYEPQKPCALTWCVYEALTLTEDRTLAHAFMFDWHVRRAVCSSDDADLIRYVLTAPVDTYEGSLDFRGDSFPTSETFREVASKHGRAGVRSMLFAVAPVVYATVDWKAKLLDAMERGEPEEVGRVALEHKTELQRVLRKARARELGEPEYDSVDF